MANQDLHKIFARRLRELRKARGETQYTLADKIDTSRSNIANYESAKGIYPSEAMLRKLSDFFKVSIDYLIGNSDDPTEMLTADKVSDFRDQLDRYRQILANGGTIPYGDREIKKQHLDMLQRFLDGYILPSDEDH